VYYSFVLGSLLEPLCYKIEPNYDGPIVDLVVQKFLLSCLMLLLEPEVE
jgi:hypothetical protein